MPLQETYRRILAHDLSFPPHFGPWAKDLVNRLLNVSSGGATSKPVAGACKELNMHAHTAVASMMQLLGQLLRHARRPTAGTAVALNHAQPFLHEPLHALPTLLNLPEPSSKPLPLPLPR